MGILHNKVTLKKNDAHLECAAILTHTYMGVCVPLPHPHKNTVVPKKFHPDFAFTSRRITYLRIE